MKNFISDIVNKLTLKKSFLTFRSGYSLSEVMVSLVVVSVISIITIGTLIANYNKQQIVVYAVRGDGTWEYNPKDHSIKCVIEGDMRNKFDNSGLIILYAAPQNDKFAPLHVGSMYQNVGLMCASLNLANCVKHTKHDALDKELNLPQDYRSYIAHSIAEVKV